MAAIRMLIVAALLACFALGVAVLLVYGGESYWPSVVTGFSASLLAFMLALSWENERERNRIQRDASDLEDRRSTEVRRRFESVRKELEKNAESLEFLDGRLDTRMEFLNPQLLEGAWVANGARLSELVADHALIGDLAITYGRIEELRWRLRYRTEAQAHPAEPSYTAATVGVIDEMTAPLATDLVTRVGAQIAAPHRPAARPRPHPQRQPFRHRRDDRDDRREGHASGRGRVARAAASSGRPPRTWVGSRAFRPRVRA